MRDWTGKRYWIVGASEGLGRAVAQRLSARGAEVILSARSTDRLEDLAASLPGKASVVAIDVANAASVADAFAKVGDFDGLVFLAGVYWPQSAVDWNAEQVNKMFDVNLTGAARVLGHVVPAMVAKGSGHIVLTGSISGYRGLPGAIGYGASKAGIMYLAQQMHGELGPRGIDVQLVNPGFIKTRLTEKNDFKMPFIMEPEEAAAEVVDHMQGERFAANFPLGFSLVFRLSRLLPAWLYYRLFF
ncbi:SDR family NAD(P)-dependent oxidoreductase [Oceaniglobus indicus]|uniref:SDR family NAD(P)-dependent oxidoreductase n=1 Tax=Oceaniglobus indicus TaxID=2047749 RepID=UPI000C1928BE|nr:SDR family NAD(P)-dependent oxidoreductase [Oceaniglobus indicus]